MVHAGFDDGGPILTGEVHQGLGHADLVIVVGLGFEGRAVLTQDSGYHLLGGGLAGGAGDLDEGDVEEAAIPGGQGLQAQHGVRYLDVELAGQQGFGGLGADAACGALLQGHGDVGVAIEALAHQGDEEVAGGDLAAVGGHAGKGGTAALEQRAVDSADQIRYLTFDHFFSAFLAFRDSSTMVSHRSA